MNSIVLYGALKERYGENFELDVRDPGEAVRAMCSQLPGMRQMILENDFYVLREMPNGTFALDETMFSLSMVNCRLHIMPSIDGAAAGGKKKGGIKLVLGVAMIAGSFLIPGSSVFMGMALKGMVFMAGVSMALGGAAVLLSPQAKLDTGGGDNKDSVLFGSNPNTSGQNLAVPRYYGVCRIPGIPVASSIVTNQTSSGNAFESRANAIFGVGGSYRYRQL